MIRFTLLLVLACLACIGNLQAAVTNDTTIYNMADKLPEYPGGHDSLLRKVTSNIFYPQVCADSNIQGKVYLRFVVNTDGSISHLQTVKSPHPLLSAAAIKAMEGLSLFKPATLLGKPVRVWYSFPISFKARAVEITDIDSLPKQATIQWGKLQQTRDVFDYYKGGYSAFTEFMAANTIFPQLSKKNKIEAFLMVQCMVDEQLKLTPVEVVNDVDGVFTNEAIRVLNMVPALDEGARKAGLVGSKLYVTIAFVFGGEEALFNTRSARADTAALYTDIGIDLINKGLYTDAVGKLDIALKYMTTDSRAFYNRAMAKLKLNNSIAACDDFKRAILLGYQQAVDYVKIYCK